MTDPTITPLFSTVDDGPDAAVRGGAAATGIAASPAAANRDLDDRVGAP
jgi:hypothetical protein